MYNKCSHLIYLEQSPRVRIAIPARRGEDSGFPDMRPGFSPLHARVRDFCPSEGSALLGRSPCHRSRATPDVPSTEEGLTSQKGSGGQQRVTGTSRHLLRIWHFEKEQHILK